MVRTTSAVYGITTYHGESSTFYYVTATDPTDEGNWEIVDTFRSHRAARRYLDRLRGMSAETELALIELGPRLQFWSDPLVWFISLTRGERLGDTPPR